MTTFADLKQAISDCPRKEDGVFASDLELLPEVVQSTLRKMMRQSMLTVGEIQAALSIEGDEARWMVEALLEKGYVIKNATDLEGNALDEPAYSVHIARKRGGTAPLKIWEAIDQ